MTSSIKRQMQKRRRGVTVVAPGATPAHLKGDAAERARFVLASVTAAVKNGVVHTHIDGTVIENPEHIMHCVLTKKLKDVDTTNAANPPVTTAEKEYLRAGGRGRWLQKEARKQQDAKRRLDKLTQEQQDGLAALARAHVFNTDTLPPEQPILQDGAGS